MKLSLFSGSNFLGGEKKSLLWNMKLLTYYRFNYFSSLSSSRLIPRDPFLCPSKQFEDGNTSLPLWPGLLWSLALMLSHTLMQTLVLEHDYLAVVAQNQGIQPPTWKGSLSPDSSNEGWRPWWHCNVYKYSIWRAWKLSKDLIISIAVINK